VSGWEAPFAVEDMYDWKASTRRDRWGGATPTAADRH
jgi:hypothetical protein